MNEQNIIDELRNLSKIVTDLKDEVSDLKKINKALDASVSLLSDRVNTLD